MIDPKTLTDEEVLPSEKDIEEMEVGDTIGFNDGDKHWTITRDE